VNETHPSVVVLAGSNGAGKSTVAPALLHGALTVDEFVNADVIASGLSAFDPESAAIAAGRVMLGRLRELAEQRVSFAFETTWLAVRLHPGFGISGRLDTEFTCCSSGCHRRNLPSTESPIGSGLEVMRYRRKPSDAGIGQVCATSSVCTSHSRRRGGCTTVRA